MRVAVSLLVCNRRAVHVRATDVALGSLALSDACDARLLVVDNGSTPPTESLTGEVVRLDENAGIAAGRNVAARILLDDGADVVVEIHNDMVFPRVWLGPLLDVLAAHPTVGLASSSLMTHRGTIGSPRVPIDYTWATEQIIDTVERNAVAARRPGLLRAGLQHPVAKRAAMLHKIGLYDERFAGMNFEDTDEVRRARAAGWQYVVVGDSVVWHHYVFSRLELGDHHRSFVENLRRFQEKWPDSGAFLRDYGRETEMIYRR